MSEKFDIAIVGGGMVGGSLAVSLEGLGLRVALIEAVPHDSASQPSFDERTTALSNGSRRILETLGLWPAVSGAATPIRKIHVSDQGRFGFARVDAAEQGLTAMGYVVPNRSLGAALWARLSRSGSVRVFCPAHVTRVHPTDRSVELNISAGRGEDTVRADARRDEGAGRNESAVGAGSPAAGSPAAESSAGTDVIEARLVVAADGAQSAVRSAFGVAAEVRDYEQTAVTTAVLPQRFHEYVAYERFTASGPMALLPLADGRCTLVLTLKPDVARAALAWSDEEFIGEVQRRFGFRLGRFLKVGRRVPYPLSLTRSDRSSSGRCVMVGNAAQGLHPVAGMGFNLGLRDAASLAELVADRQRVPHPDLGDGTVQADYDAWRAADRGGIIAFTDGLIRVFANPLGTVRRLRDLGLLAFDVLPPAKSALSRLSTGASGRIPKLARGVALR
jgi:2-octaprenyl-6-methoxyphenol hydroxylase